MEFHASMQKPTNAVSRSSKILGILQDGSVDKLIISFLGFLENIDKT